MKHGESADPTSVYAAVCKIRWLMHLYRMLSLQKLQAYDFNSYTREIFMAVHALTLDL